MATIAQIFLTPNSRARLCEVLPEFAKCHLAPVAAWADTVRNPSTGPLHYLNGNDDWPADHCTFGEKGWKDPRRNVLVGIVNSTLGVSTLSGYVMSVYRIVYRTLNGLGYAGRGGILL